VTPFDPGEEEDAQYPPTQLNEPGHENVVEQVLPVPEADAVRAAHALL
jgi:hypothetical protein